MRRTAIFITLLLASLSLGAQRAGQSVIECEIRGQIRIGDVAAPQGVLVLLDSAPAFTAGVMGSGEIARTMTDSSGKFVFGHIRMAQGEQVKFLVTVHFAGYRDTSRVAELKGSPRAYLDISLQPDTSGKAPNVPPGGPGAAVSARQPASPKAQEALAKGEDLLIRRHNPKDSIKEFKKVVEIEPQYGPGYILLATAYLQVQQWDDSKSAFEKAAKLEPKDANAFLGLGLVLNEQKDFTAALKPLQHSLELRPDSPEAHYETGKSLWALGKWQDAEPHARKALELNKDFAEAHILMGNIYLRHRDANSALNEFQEYLKLAPQGRYAGQVNDMVAKIEKALPQR